MYASQYDPEPRVFGTLDTHLYHSCQALFGRWLAKWRRTSEARLAIPKRITAHAIFVILLVPRFVTSASGEERVRSGFDCVGVLSPWILDQLCCACVPCVAVPQGSREPQLSTYRTPDQQE